MTAAPTVARAELVVRGLSRSWTPCDSCGMRLAAVMVRAYDFDPPMHNASSGIWLVCDGCRPPEGIAITWPRMRGVLSGVPS